jgi:hypothetical protein
VTSELAKLLALQDQDDVVGALLERLEALAPRLAALDAARANALRILEETRALVDVDEHRQREVEGRISDHRQRHERNLSHLDAVKRMREATAAMAQVEAGRKVLADEENELKSLIARIAEGHATIRRQEKTLADLDAEQLQAREVISSERSELDSALAKAREVRGGMASKVEAGVLHKYERIRGRRRAQAVFALTSGACSSCDTAVPVQRRKMMANTGVIEVCEACGVLLYASG